MVDNFWWICYGVDVKTESGLGWVERSPRLRNVGRYLGHYQHSLQRLFRLIATDFVIGSHQRQQWYSVPCWWYPVNNFRLKTSWRQKEQRQAAGEIRSDCGRSRTWSIVIGLIVLTRLLSRQRLESTGFVGCVARQEFQLKSGYWIDYRWKRLPIMMFSLGLLFPLVKAVVSQWEHPVKWKLFRAFAFTCHVVGTLVPTIYSPRQLKNQVSNQELSSLPIQGGCNLTSNCEAHIHF